MKFLMTLLCLVLFATASFAVAVPSAADADLIAVSDLLGTTPDWLKVDTSFICFPSNGPYTCSYPGECQSYFGLPSNYECVNPSGQLCSGHCEPC